MDRTMGDAVPRIWRAITQGGVDLVDERQRPQLYVVSVFSILAFISLAFFGALQVYAEHVPRLGYLELAGSCTILLNMLALRLTSNVGLARNLLLLCILDFLMIMVVSGGTEGTGIFWFFTYPVGAFFLAGKRGGSYWMLALLCSTVVLLLFAYFNVIEIAYSFITIRQLLFSVAVVTVGIYAYQHAREEAEKVVAREQKELDGAKNEFLSLASHQLRTPISAISWFSEMLLHGDAGALDDTKREYVEQVYASNQRSAAIVDAIITVSSLQTKMLITHLEPTDLPRLCEQLIKNQLESKQARSLKIGQHYEAGLPKLRCDAALVRTIIQNLLSNAIKYTPPGGRVDVTVKQVSEKLTTASRGSIAIVVQDTGYGIPKNQQDKIFAKLFRASNIKSKDTDGTGLGLYIVREILERVGGRIDFRSEEGEGSTFTVLIPLEGMQVVSRAGVKQ